MNEFLNKIGIALAVTASLASCSSSSDDAAPADGARHLITFSPMEIATRASQTTVNTLSSYGVSCSLYRSTDTYTSAAIGSYFYNEEIQTTSGVSDHYWPGENNRVSFFAYAPYGNSNLTISPAETMGRPVYTLTVPSDIEQQVDFITAEVLDRIGSSTDEPVKLTFEHRCSDVRLAIYNRGDDPITVNSISISGVKYQGSFDGSTWTLSGDANSVTSHPFTLTPKNTVTVAAKDTVDVTDSVNHFILLPQTVASGTIFITVNTTLAGVTKDQVYTLPSDFNLQQGRSHYLTISLSADYIDVDTGSDITDWGVDVKYLTTDGVNADGNMTQPGAGGNSGTDAQDWGTDNQNASTDSVKTDSTWTQPGATGGSGTDVKNWEQQEGQPS